MHHPNWAVEARVQAERLLKDLRSGDEHRSLRAARLVKQIPTHSHLSLDEIVAGFEPVQRKHAYHAVAVEWGEESWYALRRRLDNGTLGRFYARFGRGDDYHSYVVDRATGQVLTHFKAAGAAHSFAEALCRLPHLADLWIRLDARAAREVRRLGASDGGAQSEWSDRYTRVQRAYRSLRQALWARVGAESVAWRRDPSATHPCIDFFDPWAPERAAG